ncbi:MAG: type I restriction endonuclease subunit R [Planctomycetes bacterium]|nr:type I restriction endonuclease subunit R [Planctomycetota bacterium]
MAGQTKEEHFENAIEHTLLSKGGYTAGDKDKFDKARAIFPEDVLAFVQKTQPKEWDYLVNLQGDKAAETLLADLCRALDSDHEGSLHVLRHGFKCFGKTFKLAQFAPASGMNPDVLTKYKANILTITRQLRYNEAHNNELDVTLALNGIPLVTAELKNAFTGQKVGNAINQYKSDRDPKDLMFQFKKRSLVHFAVDTDEVFMTTRLNGPKTYFLPFNRGNNGGAGNPPNPDGWKTSYLWEQVLTRDSLLNILARYIHLEVTEKKLSNGKKVKKETMIFPRYHQLDCVRKLIADARENGTGNNYLVQHSAGSGKSNSIAWLSHQLSTLHDEKDAKVFDSVIVVTDRIVLDKQLQDTVFQFEHKPGVVVKIDEDSTQLATALEGGTPIIITTLQKFPFAAEKMGAAVKRKYAVVIDEAHSSQSGESAKEMKSVLSKAQIEEAAAKAKEEENLTDTEEEILKVMHERGRQPNVSFFAFTATPKFKTLQVFGHTGADGQPTAFHNYTMRQAIDEGFILDVLANYTTYKAFYRLVKSIEDDPEVDKKKAARALARFMSLHPHNIAQKTEVMIEHFRAVTRHKIGGRAKAMLVTSSRLHAVRYKQAFDAYIKEKGYTDIRTLVAFSGTVADPDVAGVEYTEPGMNIDANGKKVGMKELPDRFDTPEFHVLIVAEKYQTGFDQPLLHTMYVDKRLSGIQAVQTLSRLNRTAPGKEDTFVLDFVNETEEIEKSFQPYYERTTVEGEATVQQLYELRSRLAGYQIYFEQEVNDFCEVFYKPKPKQTSLDHGKMNAVIDPVVVRFSEREGEEQEEFRQVLAGYKSLYSFLSQVIPFQDSDLEKLYSFIRFLIKKLPRADTGPAYNFGDDVALEYYRLQLINEGSIALQPGAGEGLKGPSDVGTGVAHTEEVALSELIQVLNERFGTEFTNADQLFFDQIEEDAVADDAVRQAAKVNSEENFGLALDEILTQLVVDRMDQNEDTAARILNEEKFRETVKDYFTKRIYKRLSEDGDEAQETP